MKTNRTLSLLAGFSFFVLLIVSCHKSEIPVNQESADSSRNSYVTATLNADGSVTAGGVTITAPASVEENEAFNIHAAVSCGKVAIERGYILAGDGVTKIYKDLTCQSANLLWEEVVTFQCYTTDASWNGSLSQAGNYVYRTKHNGNDGNCDGLGGGNQTGNCSFNGNEFYCFMIEVTEGCETAFTGQAIACGSEREANYTFTSKDALAYIKIQGGLTNFTGADAVVTITGGNLTASQSTPGGSSNRIIKIEGSVAECETISIKITWSSTNTGGTITGSWSVKDANGNELASPVPGLTCGG